MKHCICNRPQLIIKNTYEKYHIQCISCNRRGESAHSFENAKNNWNGLYVSIKREFDKIGIDKELLDGNKTISNN